MKKKIQCPVCKNGLNGMDVKFRAKHIRICKKTEPANHTPGPCGCHEKTMQTGIGEFPDGMDFCPLHAAAPDLLKLLKELVGPVTEEEFRKGMVNSYCHDGLCSIDACGNCSRYLRGIKIIAKAEGRTI